MDRYYFVMVREGNDYNARRLVIVLPRDSELDEVVSMALQGVNMTSNAIHAHGSILDAPGVKRNITQLKRHVASPKIIKLFKKTAVKLLGD